MVRCLHRHQPTSTHPPLPLTSFRSARFLSHFSKSVIFFCNSVGGALQQVSQGENARLWLSVLEAATNSNLLEVYKSLVQGILVQEDAEIEWILLWQGGKKHQREHEI